MNKIAVLGSGNNVNQIGNLINNSKKLQLSGCSQLPEPNTISFNNSRYITDNEELINSADILVLVNNDFAKFSFAQIALKKFRHVFIHNPVNLSLSALKLIAELAKESGSQVSVNLPAINNPLFQYITAQVSNPVLIDFDLNGKKGQEARFTDSIFDKYITDIVLTVISVKSPVKKVLSKTITKEDQKEIISSIRIEFNNATSASILIDEHESQRPSVWRWFNQGYTVKLELSSEQKIPVIESEILSQRLLQKYNHSDNVTQTIHIDDFLHTVNSHDEQFIWALEKFSENIIDGTAMFIKLDDLITGIEVIDYINKRLSW